MNITPVQLRLQYELANRLWPWIHEVNARFKFPPFMLHAIASRETNFNPYYIDHPGDKGNGHGLWQIDKRYHTIPPDWKTNIRWQCEKGAEVLSDSFKQCGTWLGAANDYNSGSCRTENTTGKNYGPDVMERRAWLEANFKVPTSAESSDSATKKRRIKMFLFWHEGAIWLAVPPYRSPYGLGPQDIDPLTKGGVPVCGKQGEKSGFMDLKPWNEI